MSGTRTYDWLGALKRDLYMGKNGLGEPLTPDCRARLIRVAENPTEPNWDSAHGIILYGRLTLWQAIMAMDSTFPNTGPTSDSMGKRLSAWKRVPSRDLILAAIRYATH